MFAHFLYMTVRALFLLSTQVVERDPVILGRKYKAELEKQKKLNFTYRYANRWWWR